MIARVFHQAQRFSILKSSSQKFTSSSYLQANIETNGNLLHLKAEGFLEILPLNSDHYLETLLKSAPKQTIYCGFDPTATSLQLGNLAALIALLRCQQFGHNVIALIGSATGFIGDPSGRETDRPDMLQDTLSRNVNGMRQDIQRIMTNHQKIYGDSASLGSWEIVENMDWYREENVIDFMSRVGGHLKLKDLLSRDSVKLRSVSKEGMNIKEFLYPLFQAYDWAHLFKSRNCRFQIGGNDQIGNITSGQFFIEKMFGEKTFGLTIPLFTIGGKKVGKSSGSADTLWLSQIENAGSAYNLYQKLLKTPDTLLADMLAKFTLLTTNQRTDIIQEHQLKPELRGAQNYLAEEITRLVHGELALDLVREATRVFFHCEQTPISPSQHSHLIEHPAYCPVLTADDKSTVRQLIQQMGRISALRDNKSEDAEIAKVLDLATRGKVKLNCRTLDNLDELVNPPDSVINILKFGKYDFWFVVNNKESQKTKINQQT